jgi:hypothetical protein
LRKVLNYQTNSIKVHILREEFTFATRQELPRRSPNCIHSYGLQEESTGMDIKRLKGE